MAIEQRFKRKKYSWIDFFLSSNLGEKKTRKFYMTTGNRHRAKSKRKKNEIRNSQNKTNRHFFLLSFISFLRSDFRVSHFHCVHFTVLYTHHFCGFIYFWCVLCSIRPLFREKSNENYTHYFETTWKTKHGTIIIIIGHQQNNFHLVPFSFTNPKIIAEQ